MSAPVHWLAPAPLWGPLSARPGREPLHAPALLRFVGDEYMEELQALLAARPAALAGCVARPESWRAPAAGLGAPGDPPPQGGLTLFQPVHGRFYLVAATLACRVAGFPDRAPRGGEARESATFVVRRVVPRGPGGDPADPARRAELAWTAEGDGHRWVPAPAAGVAAGEEQLPLFTLLASDDGGAGRRRLFAGLVPVSNRERYVSARRAPASGAAEPPDPRRVQLRGQVTAPWADLADWWQNRMGAAERDKPAAREGLEQGSALLLLDLADWLAAHLPAAWSAVAAEARPGPGPVRALWDALGAPLGQAGAGSVPLRQALRVARELRAGLEGGAAAGLPPGLPRVRLTDPAAAALLAPGPDGVSPLETLAAAALPPLEGAPTAAAPAAAAGDPWFVVRCVFLRPRCGPECQALLSAPTAAFRMASFFDPDAPARLHPVALPADTSPAALRRYAKGASFTVSGQLAAQMERIRGLKQLAEGDVGAPGGIGIGTVCSFSIPIITLCAFIVLMIFVQLLNLVFWWLPFLKICFPVPTAPEE